MSADSITIESLAKLAGETTTHANFISCLLESAREGAVSPAQAAKSLREEMDCHQARTAEILDA